MGTDNLSSSVPEFKLAKVGKERRRRGGGGFFSLGGGSGSGSGAIGAISGLGGKIAVSLLVATLGVGAFSVGKVLAPDDKNFKADKKPKLFASAEKPKYAGDLSNLPGMQARQSGLGMVAGSIDGMTPEERAAKAKADADAAQAAADAQAKADADGAKQAPGQSGVPNDPAALAAAAAGAGAGQDKGMNRKFGELSKGLGGLSGGSGMSGGFSRGFDAPKLGGSAGNLSGFNNARASVGRSKVRTASVGRAGMGLARRQLGSVSQLSRAAQGSAGHDMSAALASRGFDNNPAQGTAITGAGAGQSGSPTGATSGGDTTTRNPVGGPVAGDSGSAAPDDCNALFPDGGYINSSAGGCVKAVSGTSVDPTDKLFQILKLLAMLSGIICAFLVAVSVFQWTWVGAGLVKILAGALVAIGAIEAMLGIMLIGMGRTIEGGIFTLLGAGTAYIGYSSYVGVASGATTLFTGLSTTAQNVIMGLTSAMQLGAGLNNYGSRGLNADTNRWE